MAAPAAVNQPWQRHTVDRFSRGADGVRLADVNGDGHLDVVTPWEEGGVVRLCVNPGPEGAKRPWPGVTVGRVRSPEDAVLVDLDGNGALDVVTSCEGRTRTVYVHWAPTDPRQLLDETAWQTEAIPATAGKQRWMFALPMQIDGTGGIDLLVGSKNAGATVSWLQSPSDPRDLSAWKLHRLCEAGWIMSLVAEDIDGDGDDDVVFSDRFGPRAGVHWLENPSWVAESERSEAGETPRTEPSLRSDPATPPTWRVHTIGAEGREVLFLTVADLDGDGHRDVLTSTREGEMVYLRRTSQSPLKWESYLIANPSAPEGKAVRVADVDLDGRPDILNASYTAGDRATRGLMWMRYRQAVTDEKWEAHDISGPEGVKFDLLEPLDLDGDGDLDVLTCEERDNLGVVWYENPTR